MLKFIYCDVPRGINLFIYRQPKKKEELFSSCWGRLVYWANFGKYSGPAIIFECQDLTKELKWKSSQTPFIKKELSRLEDDGHKVIYGKRHIEIVQNLESIRSTQLFRTLLHEFGHYHDPNSSDRSFQEREDYAHRYASDLQKKLKKSGAIPFDRILDKDSINSRGLRKEWFERKGL